LVGDRFIGDVPGDEQAIVDVESNRAIDRASHDGDPGARDLIARADLQVLLLWITDRDTLL
jgi:hypothetical protein